LSVAWLVDLDKSARDARKALKTIVDSLEPRNVVSLGDTDKTYLPKRFTHVNHVTLLVIQMAVVGAAAIITWLQIGVP